MNAVLSGTEAASRPGTASTVQCAHCRLPVPVGLLKPDTALQFCCGGCRVAYDVIHGAGLESFYDYCERLDQPPPKNEALATDFDELDHPAFQSQHVSVSELGTARAVLSVSGLSCLACAWLIEQLPRTEDGWIDARVDWARRTVRLTYDSRRTSLSAIAGRLARLGYVLSPWETARNDSQLRREGRQRLQMIAIAGACAGNVMLISVALYAGWSTGIEAAHEQLFRVVSGLLAMVAVAVPGREFFRNAYHALRSRTPHMDVTLALGLSTGLAMGIVNVVRDSGEIYFDSLCMLVFVLLVGRFIQFRQQRRAAESVSLLRGLIPRWTFRIRDDHTTERIPIEAVQVGDHLLIPPGEPIPADGEIANGSSHLDQSLLTGESRRISVSDGELVSAGAQNLTGPLELRVTATGEQTRIGRVMRLVETASHERAPIVELAHRVAGRLLIVVIVLAAITLLMWWNTNAETAIDHTIALLIVACPCALGLATPLTIAVSQGRAASRGILVRSGEALERLNRPGRLWLDKTGTVTFGQLEVRVVHGDNSAWSAVAAIESQVPHPVAEALESFANGRIGTGGVVNQPREVTSVRVDAGRGVSAQVDGDDFWIGSLEGSRLRNIAVQNGDLRLALGWIEQGWSPIVIAKNGSAVTLAAIGDALRPEAVEAVDRLRRGGWEIGLLSGDHPEIVARYGEQLGLPPELVKGGMSPEDKVREVRADQGTKTVVMVGDGVNDAAALAAADVGIAVHGGAQASLQAADVYLSHAGLEPLVELMAGSRETWTVIRRNLGLSLFYNATAMTLAVCGLMTPLFAAVLMPLSSLTVVGVATLQQTFGRRP